jgi:hypothetical protein
LAQTALAPASSDRLLPNEVVDEYSKTLSIVSYSVALRRVGSPSAQVETTY